MKYNNILHFAVNEPYELFYKKDIATSPVGAHTHNVAEIYLTLSDLPDALLNDTVSRINKGSLIIIPPFCVHQLYHEKGVDYERYIMNVDTEWIKYILSNCKINAGYINKADKPLIIALDENQLRNVTYNMNRFISVQQKKSIASIALFLELYDEIDCLIRNTQKNDTFERPVVTSAQERVNEIIAYINSNLMEEISVEKIAKHFYLNKDYISRLFSKHTHTTIGRYIALQRISRAQEMLRIGKTVTQVQELMGYSSYAHFFKTFLKHTGISPSRYRKQFFKDNLQD